jgi:hypothetical protein
MPSSKWLTSALLASMTVTLLGCADPACESGAPSLQVNVIVDADIATSEIARVVADVSTVGRKKTTDLDAQPLKDDGRASFVVIVGAGGKTGFDYIISVKLLDGAGAELAKGLVESTGVGNGCNTVSLLLSRGGIGDGGADGGDGGGPDSADGSLADGATDAPHVTTDGGIADALPDERVADAPAGPLTYVLSSQTNVNLQAYLVAQGARSDREIIIQIPAGVTIGGTSAGSPAIVTGDLSAFQKVVLEVSGEVQGAGGTANGGTGGSAIHAASIIHLTLKAGGAIRGGGGGGGKGGTGAPCDNPNWTHIPNATKTYWKNYGSYSPPSGITLVLESTVEQWRVTPMDRNMVFTYQAGQYWKRGSLVSGANSGTYDAWFDHYRATAINNGNGGAGGNGGQGQGYGQSASGGAAGGTGTYTRCGKGGTGGAGGSWGAKGLTGGKGAGGLKHSTYNLSTPQAGSGGAAGGAAGKALSCASTGIYFVNEGTVDGAIGCSLL